MKTYRKTAVIVGILFIIGTVSGILSAVVTSPIMAGSTYPLNISASEPQWIIGTLLILLMGFPLAMVPVFLYPILKKQNEVLALGSIVFRGVLEAVCYMGMVISNFLLLTVSQVYEKTSDPEISLQTLGSSLISAGDWTSLLLGLVFSIGGMMIYILFFQTRLRPSMAVKLGFHWCNIVFCCPHRRNFWLAAGSIFRIGSGVLDDTSCHSGNGLCSLVDREGIQSICDRCPGCENRITH